MRYNQTGTVLEVDGEYVVWRSYQDNKKVVDNIHDLRKVNKMTMMSPVSEAGLFSDGKQFSFQINNKPYEPGNPIYDKYKGEYHKHTDGHICAGPHDMGNIVMERILKKRIMVVKRNSFNRRVFEGKLN